MTIFITWVNALFTVFILCILIRILMSWVTIAPIRPWARNTVEFFHDTTDWYLGAFRRFIPPLGPLDLSPIVAVIVVVITQTFVVRILDSFV